MNTKKKEKLTAFKTRKKPLSNCIFYRTHIQEHPWVPMERQTIYDQESHRRK